MVAWRSAPTARRIVTGSEDGTAKVWDARTGSALLELKGHKGAVTSASFSPDGSRIVTGIGDAWWAWDRGSGIIVDESNNLYLGFFDTPANTARVRDTQAAKVWDARTGQELKGEPAPTGNPVEPDQPGRSFDRSRGRQPRRVDPAAIRMRRSWPIAGS